MMEWYQSYDSTINSYYAVYSRRFEMVGQFWIVGYKVGGKGQCASSPTGRRDSSGGSVAYKRIGKYLYYIDKEYKIGERLDPVNLDSALPCGQPFVFFPKPANWTLF
jgi:hypothetical protein